jgi:hypothetical protein
MRVQHRSGTAFFYNLYVEQRLVRRLTSILVHDASIFINRQNLLRPQFTLINPTRTHRDSERLPLDHGTKIPTRPQQPPTRMKPLRYRGELRCNL